MTKEQIVNNWYSVCDHHLLPHLLEIPKRQFPFPLILFAIGSMLTVFSLAGPSWKKATQPIYRTLTGSIVVLNLTPSMMDLVGTTKKIDRAHFKMLDLFSRLREGMLGLVVYTDEAHTIAPLTDDYHTLANFVPSLDPSIMPSVNDNTAVGLQRAGKLLRQAGIPNGNIILITDKITHLSTAKNVASMLFSEGYHLIVFNITDQENSMMRELASAGGGKVISLTSNNHDIDKIIADAQSKINPFQMKKTNEKAMLWQDNGREILFLVLPIALLLFRRGYL